MRIEIWSDVVCPWCFIGKRRLERALEGFAHRAAVEVEYRSFELDPTAPSPATERMDAVLARKYGGGLDNARRMMARVTEVAATEGLEYHLDRTLRGSTVDAHRLLHLALRESGPRAQAALKESLMAAYLTRAEDITDHDVLRRACAAAGLDPDRVDAVLGSQEYAEAIRADVEQARAFGASGVPFFVFDRRYAVSGAQPVEVFTEVLERAWSESHPSLTRVGDAVGDGVDDPAAATAHAPADAAACGPDGCP